MLKNLARPDFGFGFAVGHSSKEFNHAGVGLRRMQIDHAFIGCPMPVEEAK